jgi:uncharacterized protein YjbJ (UPF0337 family)
VGFNRRSEWNSGGSFQSGAVRAYGDSEINSGHRRRGSFMNEDKIKGQWKQLAGKVKAKWGKLTDDDLKIAEGNSEYLAGRVQERYGIARDEAQKQVKEFGSKL